MFKHAISALLFSGLCLGLSGCGEESPSVADASAKQPAEIASSEQSSTQTRPEWLPEAIELPQDFRVTDLRSFGSRTHLLRGKTDMNLDELFSSYRQALKQAGYSVHDNSPPREISYTGTALGIETGGISLIDELIDTGEKNVLSFDATLVSD